MQLLNKRGIKVKKANINPFLHLCKSNVLGFQKRCIYNLDTWGKVGKQPNNFYTQHGLENMPTDTFSLWNMIRDTLSPAHESKGTC